MSPPEVIRYVEAARRGDHEAFEQLVRLTYHDTYTLAYRLTGNEERRETWCRRPTCGPTGPSVVSTAMPSSPPGSTASPPIPRRPFHARPATATSSSGPTHRYSNFRADHDPAQHVDATTLRARLEIAIAELPPRLRQVIVLRDVYELPHDQIAAELGISESAAKVRLHRARRMFANGSFREINAMPYESARCRDIVSEMLDETSVVSLTHRQHVESAANAGGSSKSSGRFGHRSGCCEPTGSNHRPTFWPSSTRTCGAARRRRRTGWPAWSTSPRMSVGCWRPAPPVPSSPVAPGARASASSEGSPRPRSPSD